MKIMSKSSVSSCRKTFLSLGVVLFLAVSGFVASAQAQRAAIGHGHAGGAEDTAGLCGMDAVGGDGDVGGIFDLV